jgi:hypothetical protein
MRRRDALKLKKGDKVIHVTGGVCEVLSLLDKRGSLWLHLQNATHEFETDYTCVKAAPSDDEPMSDAEYVRRSKDRDICPFCGGDETEGDSTDFQSLTATQERTCQGCGTSYYAVYTLSGYMVN